MIQHSTHHIAWHIRLTNFLICTWEGVVRNLAGGSLRFVAGGHQDSAPRQKGEHVLNKYSCVESSGLKTVGQIHAHRRSICLLCPALNKPPDLVGLISKLKFGAVMFNARLVYNLNLGVC